MSHLEDQEVAEIKEALSAADVTFEHYLRHIVALDKTTYSKIYDDPTMRTKFSQASIEERLSFFSDEFQGEVKSLYDNQLSYKKASHALANNIYRISKLTGATYAEIAKTLEAAFSRQLSKGQISKLYKAGELLNSTPALAVVQDVEKLAALSRVPAARLSQMIETNGEGVVRVANLDIGQASRAQVQKLVEQEVPRTILRSVSTPVLAPVSLDLTSLKDQLNSALPLVNQSGLSDLSAAIVECVRIINENIK